MFYLSAVFLGGLNKLIKVVLSSTEIVGTSTCCTSESVISLKQIGRNSLLPQERCWLGLLYLDETKGIQNLSSTRRPQYTYTHIVQPTSQQNQDSLIIGKGGKVK